MTSLAGKEVGKDWLHSFKKAHRYEDPLRVTYKDPTLIPAFTFPKTTLAGIRPASSQASLVDHSAVRSEGVAALRMLRGACCSACIQRSSSALGHDFTRTREAFVFHTCPSCQRKSTLSSAFQTYSQKILGRARMRPCSQVGSRKPRPVSGSIGG